MKRIILLTLMVVSFTASQAASLLSQPSSDETDISRSQLRVLVQLKRSDYESLKGKRLNLAERWAFNISRKHAERILSESESKGFNIGGFLLGFLGNLTGVILAYVMSTDKNLRKWAWIGLGTATLLFTVIFLAVFL